jgi:hypothetical protein
LMFRLACFLGEFRFHFIQELRRCDADSAMNEANSGRPRLRFTDSLATAVVSDPVHTVRAQSATGPSAERVADVRACAVGRDVEGDSDRQR